MGSYATHQAPKGKKAEISTAYNMRQAGEAHTLTHTHEDTHSVQPSSSGTISSTRCLFSSTLMLESFFHNCVFYLCAHACEVKEREVVRASCVQEHPQLSVFSGACPHISLCQTITHPSCTHRHMYICQCAQRCLVQCHSANEVLKGPTSY